MNISRELKQDFEKCNQLKSIFREISDSGVVTFQYELLFFWPLNDKKFSKF